MKIVTRRVFRKDKGLPDTLNGISGTNCDWETQAMEVYVDDWDTLSTLTKAAVTTACTTAGYSFQRDETP